ncbi:MAG: enterochelin esterase, partial [Rhodanobacter sp.]
MRFRQHAVAVLFCLGLSISAVQARTGDVPAHRFFHVQMGAASTQPTSGRLLLFATDAKAAEAEAGAESHGKDSTVEEVDANPFRATETSVAAREVSQWVPTQSVDIDADQMAFPAGYSKLPPGDYVVQAVLDVDHSYNYSGRGAGDLVSAVVKVHLPTASLP